MAKRQRVADELEGTFKTRALRKGELIVKLQEKGVILPKRFISKPDILQIAQANGVLIENQEAEIEQGWVGKPKGLKQILRERGLLDLANLALYTVDGPKDDDGKVDCSKSYKKLMESCTDFKREKTALQHLGEKLQVTVGATPKYHAEIAGEGIEYVWALSKNWFKRQPLTKRKTRGQFKELVVEALSSEVVRTTKVVRGCGRRSRSYVLAYLFLHRHGDEEAVKKEFVDIELTSKKYRTHRGPSDQQSHFINLL